MNDKRNTKLAAVIEVEPTFAKLKLTQLKKGKPEELENLETPLHIGSELFLNREIGSENIRELAKALRGYGKMIQDYGVETCPVIVGQELLSAENWVFLLERLTSRSGFTPQTYGFSLENALICQEVMRALNLYVNESGRCSIVAVFGDGTLGVTAFTDDRAVSVRAFPAGPLKLGRLFSTVPDMSDVAEATEEYLDRLFLTEPFETQENRAKPVMVLTGHAVEPIARLCGARNGQRLEPKKIGCLFEQMRNLTPDRIGMRFGMTEEEAGRLYFILAAARSLTMAFSPASVLVFKTDLTDALTRQILFSKDRSLFQSRTKESAVSSARLLLRRSGGRAAHAEFIQKVSCKIFERLQKEYGLDGEKRLVLELAAILKDNGRSAEEEIYGIEKNTRSLISAVLKETRHSSPGKPANEKELTVRRISAILGVAEALDFSLRQKLENIKIKIEKGKLKMIAESREGTALEKWALENRASLFSEVFGLTPELTVKFAGTVR